MIATNKQIAVFSPRIPTSLHNTLGHYNDTTYIREKQLSTIIENNSNNGIATVSEPPLFRFCFLALSSPRAYAPYCVARGTEKTRVEPPYFPRMRFRCHSSVSPPPSMAGGNFDESDTAQPSCKNNRSSAKSASSLFFSPPFRGIKHFV